MSRLVRSAHPQTVFTTRSEIEDYFHAKVARNTKGLIGTELELFVFDAQNRPLHPQETAKFILAIQPFFENSTAITENSLAVGLHLPDVGNISLEPGGQVEMSTVACANLEELETFNTHLLNSLKQVTQDQGLILEGRGHKQEFLEAPDAARSRFAAYYRYCRDQHGEPANDLIKTMKSVCGLQINLDPMGKDFHEIYRALLLVELGHHFETRSVRQQRLQETYANLFPEQVTPMFNALAARDNETLIRMIVDRFLTLKVPFLPDATKPEGFVSTLDVFKEPPRIGDLLEQGLLTQEVLDNCLSLQMTMPNLRGSGVVETRAPDSTDCVGELMQTAAHYHGFAYDTPKRQMLLKDFKGIDPDKLQNAFDKRFSHSANDSALMDIGGGKTVGDLIVATQRKKYPKMSL